MPLSLTARGTNRPAPLSIEFDGVVPDRLTNVSTLDVARLRIRADGLECQLGDLFTVDGEANDERLLCVGDFSRVHGVGAGMQRGVIDVRGSVGRHAGEAMGGGTLIVSGDAGDWLASEMAGGCIRVEGRAGDNVAAARPGSRQGMRGGLVIVAGDVGCCVGARMRRGILAIGGSCGEAAAFEMLAGTVVVAGTVGPRPGMGMRRGSLVALSACPDVPPTFRRGAAWSPGFLPFLGTRLARSGFRPAARREPSNSGPLEGIWQQWHGDRVDGGRGEIFHRPVA